jgi:hypothetical protein
MPATTQNAIIPAGGFLSSVINATNANTGITRIIHPAGWTNRAWCTVLMSYDGATFNDLFHRNGQPVIITSSTVEHLVDEEIYQQLAYFKLRSGAKTTLSLSWKNACSRSCLNR